MKLVPAGLRDPIAPGTSTSESNEGRGRGGFRGKGRGKGKGGGKGKGRDWYGGEDAEGWDKVKETGVEEEEEVMYLSSGSGTEPDS